MTEPAAPSAHPDPPGALRMGTRLGEFELRSVIGVGGFGIVYLAFDHALEREIAIKEYMPASLAGRGGSAQVAPLSLSTSENFETGLRSFVNEGRMLARFDSPSLLKVHRFWEANGTAYIAMPLYRGRTLKEVRAAMPAPPDEAAARALLMPLLKAVDLLHRESIFHRDIAPDNILIEADDRPVLLDFGAARRVIGEQSQALTAILKPAYAPIEQYGEAASVKQGAWTDLYALGATMHYLLLGQAPPPSTTRAVQDEMQPLAERELPGCSKPFLQAIDWMLAPRPNDRPQSVSALVDVLEGRSGLPLRDVGAGGVGGGTGTALRSAAAREAVAPDGAARAAPAAAAPQASATAAAAPGAADRQATQRVPAAVSPAEAATPSSLVPAPAPAAVKMGPPPVDIPIDVPAVPPSGGLHRLGIPALLMLLLIGAAAWWYWPKPAPPVLAPAASNERGAPAIGSVPAAPPAAPTAAERADPLPATKADALQPAAPAQPNAPAATAATPAPLPIPQAPAEAPLAAAPEPPAPAPKPSVPPPAAKPVPKPAVAAVKPADAARPAVAAASARRPKPAGSSVAATGAPRPDAAPAAAPSVPAAQAEAPAAAVLAVPAATPAPKPPKGPREQCGRRVFVALLNCMNRECAKPENRRLEECSLYRPPD